MIKLRRLGRQLTIRQRLRNERLRRNAEAAGLSQPQFKPQVIRSGKAYTRWRKHKLGDDE